MPCHDADVVPERAPVHGLLTPARGLVVEMGVDGEPTGLVAARDRHLEALAWPGSDDGRSVADRQFPRCVTRQPGGLPVP